MKFPLFSAVCLVSASTISLAQDRPASAAAPAIETAAAAEEKTDGTAKVDAESKDAAESSGTEAAETKEQTAVREKLTKFLKSLRFKTGKQTLADGAVTLELPEGYEFLNAQDTRKVLVELWDNPPGTAADALGMIVPPGEDIMAQESWAVIVSLEDTGYVSDEDAGKTDYDDLLKKMQEGTEENNKERKAAGYPAMTLNGWALPPHYDHDTKVLHWAKDLIVEGVEEHSLNYDVRVLGRKGVVSLNCLAGMSQLEKVKSHTPELIAMTKFNPGHSYAEYDPATDKKAAYGIAGLIAGGAIAAKTGLFKGIFVALMAAKKFVILGVIAVAGFLKKLFGRRSE